MKKTRSSMSIDDKYTGSITVKGVEAAITFHLSEGSDNRVVFDIDPIPPQVLFLVYGGDSRPGQIAREFSLSGKSEDGKLVTSNRIYCCGFETSGTGSRIRVQAREVTVTLPCSLPIEKPLLRLWFRSFRSFRNQPIETPLGTIAVHGNTERPDIEDMSGYVAVQAPSKNSGDSWYSNADDFLRHMHRGMALAHGGRLQTPRLEYYEGSTAKVTFYAGSAFHPEFPVQNFLNHGPFIKALVDRYLSKGPLPDELWTALGWIQTDTTFDVVRLLNAMTALEAISENLLPERSGTIVPKSIFKALRPQFEGVIADSTVLSDEAKVIFVGKIAGLNKKTFAEKISELFDYYEISKCDFEGNTIIDLVKLRNEIVHRGVAPASVDLWPQIILARELITRILLKEIGFKGRYCCYVRGLHDRDFL